MFEHQHMMNLWPAVVNPAAIYGCDREGAAFTDDV